MLSDTHGFTRTFVIHLDLPSLQYSWVHQVYPPTHQVSLQYTTLVYSICKPFLFVNFATYLGSPWLQCYTPWFSYNTLIYPDLQHTGVLSLFATHCGSIGSQYTWGSLHFQHTLDLLHYNTLVYPDLQHTGVLSLSATHCGSIGSQYTWGSLLSQNTSWFFHLQQIMVLSSAVTLRFTLFAMHFGLLSSHCWFTPEAEHSSLHLSFQISVPSGLQGILAHFGETHCHPV